jgi:uncharacterized membrane protein YraQ (UPF0718 family)
MNYILWIGTIGLLLYSYNKDKKKTFTALKKAYNKGIKILPRFLIIMSGFAFIVTYISPEMMHKYIGSESGIRGVITALTVGSISVMSGFAAFPLCAALKLQGIPYYIIAAFSVTLMTVGVVTFPLEKKFLGFSVAIMRNLLSLVVAVIVVIVMKIIFGE